MIDKTQCGKCFAILPTSSFYQGRRLCKDCYGHIATQRRAAKSLNQRLLDGWQRGEIT